MHGDGGDSTVARRRKPGEQKSRSERQDARFRAANFDDYIFRQAICSPRSCRNSNKVLARYRSELPAKVMDKLKKEKSSSKKQAKSAATETKPAVPTATNITAKENTVKIMPAEVKQPAQRRVAASVPAGPEAGQQGSLFG